MKKKALIAVISVILVVALGGGIYVHSMISKINRVELPKSDSDLGITPATSKDDNDNIENIALFGLDARDPDLASRSDTIMVISIDQKTQQVKVASLMRDMYVPIPGHEDNRINAAYAFGGPALAVKTINTDFGLNIRDYVTVNFFGLEKLIDKVGGVQINVTDAEAKVLNEYLVELNKLNHDNVPFVNGGLQVLNGRQAVAYSRIRYVGDGDFQRTERQRTVLNLLFQKIKAQGVGNLPGTITTLLPYVQTSLSSTDILDLAMKTIGFNAKNIDQYRLPLDGLYKSQQIRGMDVLVPDLNANKQKLHDFIYGTQN